MWLPSQFPAAGHRCHANGTKLYCLVTKANVCEQLAQGRYLVAEWQGVELVTSSHKLDALAITSSDHTTHTHNRFMALWILSRTTRVSRYQKKHSPTHTYRGHQSSLICVLHLLESMASSLFNLHAWQSFSTICLQVFFGLPFGLAHFTSYSIHFFT